MPRTRIARVAPIAIAMSGLTLLGAAAGGVASLDSSLVAATAAQQERQIRMVDYEHRDPCPDRGTRDTRDAPSADHWRS